MHMESFESFHLMSKVKDMKSHALWILERTPNQKNLSFILDLNLKITTTTFLQLE